MKHLRLFFAILVSMSVSLLNAAHKPMTREGAEKLVQYLEYYSCHLDDDENSIDRKNYAEALSIVAQAAAPEELERIAKARQPHTAASSAAAAAAASTTPAPLSSSAKKDQ